VRAVRLPWSRQRTPPSEELLALSVGPSRPTTEREERVLSKANYEKLERLYQIDPVTFGIINELVEAIVGVGFFFEGEDE